MRRFRRPVSSLALASIVLASPSATQTPSGLPPLLPQEKEIALALEAAPEHLRSGATVYVLQRSGYVEARKGTSGTACLVGRDRPDTLEPICWDAEGADTMLPVALERARLRGEGLTPSDVDARIADGFRTGRFRAPRRAGVAYMLSPANRVWNGQRVIQYRPHVMIYAPFVTNADIGAGGGAALPWVLDEGTPHAYIIVPTAPH
jgi:hypothetical protein